MSKIAKAYEVLKGDLSNGFFYEEGESKYVFFRVGESDYSCYPWSHSNEFYEYICTVEEFNNYKPQKTVVDAVIYYGGSNFVKGKHEQHHTHVIRRGVTREYCTAYSSDIPVGNAVCTIKYYNQCIEDMSTNYGRSSQTYAEYKADYLDSGKCVFINCTTKTPLTKETKVDYTSEEFWKDAPEDATHYLPLNGEFSECWVKNLNSLNYDFMTIVRGLANDWENSGSIVKGELDGLTERPKPQPIYTKAMQEAGELPPVGAEVVYFVCCKSSVKEENFKHHEEVMDVVAINGGLVVLLSKSKSFATACNDQWIKPIDTRSDKEKAIDDIKRILDCDNHMAEGLFYSLGDIHGVTWSGNNE